MALTSTFWRNAWRYKARAFRHAFWDAGTSLANFLGVCASLELSTEVVLGFIDAEVNTLLGVDGEREATLALCAVGRGATPAMRIAELKPIAPATEPVSSAEVTFPEIPRMIWRPSCAVERKPRPGAPNHSGVRLSSIQRA
jgi:Nitroreductase family